MPELVLNGPVVKEGVHNWVLRDALFHSPVARGQSFDSYNVISIGVREGDYTTWVGSWDQSKQRIDAGVPTPMLNDGRAGMRLKSGQAVVVKIATAGTPKTLKGSRVNFRLARVGGRTGPLRPLVAAGAGIADANSRDAMTALERQINAGLSEWDESVQLTDAVAQIASGTFQGRLERTDATHIKLAKYTGNWVEVNGDAVGIGTGLTLSTGDGTLGASGVPGTTAPTSSTFYYVYVGNAQLRLSTVAPTRYLGAYYLGDDGEAQTWRLAGLVYLDGATEFTDTDTERHVVNYYNRLVTRVYTCPDYTDDNAQTTYLEVSTTWAKVNNTTGAGVSFLVTAEDDVNLSATYLGLSDTGGVMHGPAIGIDGIVDIETGGACVQVAGEYVHVTIPRIFSPTAMGRHQAFLLSRQSAGQTTVYADDARNGANVDPASTFLVGWIMA